ncbi:MAG: hypothetical protein KBD21_04255 [Candidatus Pacebacteria bacterium]|nr:hypothetical protein [Candidatus Paceibacterota bacterium]
METKTIDARLIGFTTVAALLGMGFAMAMSASAAETGLGYGAQRGTCDPEQHEAMEEAMKAGDYDAWKELHGNRGRISQVVTEENFDTFVAMHEAMEAGDTAKAQELRTELGLGVRSQDGMGNRGGMGRGQGGMHHGMGSGDGVNNARGNK